MEENKKSRNKPKPIWSLIYDNEGKIYNGVNIVYSIGVGNIGQI